MSKNFPKEDSEKDEAITKIVPTTKASLKAAAKTKEKIDKAFSERPVKSNRGRKSLDLD